MALKLGFQMGRILFTEWRFSEMRYEPYEDTYLVCKWIKMTLVVKFCRLRVVCSSKTLLQIYQGLQPSS